VTAFRPISEAAHSWSIKTIDNVARLIEIEKKTIYIYLLILSSVAYDLGDDKVGWSKKTLHNSTVLYCIYLSYEYSKRFVQPVEQPVAECKRTLPAVVSYASLYIAQRC